MIYVANVALAGLYVAMAFNAPDAFARICWSIGAGLFLLAALYAFSRRMDSR